MFLQVQEAEEANTPGHINATNQSTISQPRTFMQWLRMTIFTLFVLSGQSAAILLGRFYYDKGGKSKWTATLVQIAGFPIIIPYYYISPPEKPTTNSIHRNEPSTLILALIYVSSGSKQHDVFSWALAPSSIYFCTYLRIPVDLQCFLLLPYKFPEVYSFYNQFSSPSQRLLCPAGISNQFYEPHWKL